VSVLGFTVPAELSASEAPEARGLARDGVRLLVAGVDSLRHARFRDLAAFLDPGDLVVVNTSATLPAAVDGSRADGTAVTVHFSHPAPDGDWVVEVRRTDRGRLHDGRAGERVALPGDVPAILHTAYPDASQRMGSRLWLARVQVEGDLPSYLDRVGRPIAYDYLRRREPLASYQTIFAREPGSAEIPSAARPFSADMLVDLAVRGVAVAPVTLHCGVSSLEAGEVPLAERYRVPAATARLVNATRVSGGRVIAVGTTVTRALETVADTAGVVSAGSGWTDLVLGPDRPARVVDGLITGWHEPDASHLLLLEAVAGAELVARAYEGALEQRYLWHEFGDSCLLLPARPAER